MNDQGPPSSAEENKHLALAAAYVCDAWFPVDSGLLETVQNRLYRGTYDHDRNQLIEDLKQDTSLFLYCVRRLSEMMPTGSDGAFSPHELLHKTDLTHVREALAVHAHTISTHHNDQLDESHAHCCEFAVISATTAEELSKSYDVVPTDAYACALLRQLGLTLIAWNYPHVYRRVMSSIQDGESPDPLLQKMLGFSPQLLAVSVAKRWNLAPYIIEGMDKSEAPKTHSAAIALAKICSIGEAFAECINAENVTVPRWQEALDEIAKHLGSNGVDHLKKIIGHNLRVYAKKHPTLASWQAPEAPASGSVSATAVRRPPPVELLAQNLYVKRCAESEQKKFAELYAAIDHENPRAALDVLRNSIIPLFGFERGCIFLLEPDSMNLVPRLPLGSAALLDFASVRFNSSQAAFDPIIAAFSSKTPTIEERTSPAGNKLLFIACSLGELQRAGVLYLELGAEQAKSRRGTSPLIAFKAVRHALGDILSLK